MFKKSQDITLEQGCIQGFSKNPDYQSLNLTSPLLVLIHFHIILTLLQFSCQLFQDYCLFSEAQLPQTKQFKSSKTVPHLSTDQVIIKHDWSPWSEDMSLQPEPVTCSPSLCGQKQPREHHVYRGRAFRNKQVLVPEEGQDVFTVTKHIYFPSICSDLLMCICSELPMFSLYTF